MYSVHMCVCVVSVAAHHHDLIPQLTTILIMRLQVMQRSQSPRWPFDNQNNVCIYYAV